MEGSTESWRVKHPKKLLGENDRDEIEANEDDPKPRKDSKKHKDDETFVYCSRKKDGLKARSMSSCRRMSLLSITTSLNNNCCLCVGAFIRYIRAVFGCLSCFAVCRIPEMDFERMFCELLEATGDACYDLICFIWKILHICVGTK